MTLNICVNGSDKNVLTKAITTVASLSGTLRNDTSIIDPVITVEGNISNYAGCNYMIIPEFGRSYFINNMKSLKNGLFEISGHVDVLSTYASQIRANSGIIRKQSNLWNLYLNDDSFLVESDPYVITQAFPNGFAGQYYVLAVAG